MAIKRTIVCAVCGREEEAATPTSGWKGWGHLAGITLNGEENPTLCPEHLAKTADFVDGLAADIALSQLTLGHAGKLDGGG